ncbi:MAG: hypothetical protein H6708_17620 [Kofleriaceae bacterium]|nr:hypothetical protein [Myxococcales bacterium]MCB9562227.1 hypothetical protein [Kofleriaceae bacterium]
MKFLVLAPLPSAFGEALHGARLAGALVDRGHAAVVAAPSSVAPTVADPRIPFVAIDAALPRLDAELPALVARLGVDVLVLADAAAVDKVARAFALSTPRLAAAAPRVVSLDCWNLVRPPPTWDYGVTAEPLDPWLLQHTPVIRPVPGAPLATPGGYAALPAIAPPTPARRHATRRRLAVPEASTVIVWTTARWQQPDSHDHPALARTAARLPELLRPVLAALGDDVVVAHVAPDPIPAACRSASYRHVGQLAAADFEALLGAADALLSFNAAATSLATALGLDVPTALGTAHDPGGGARPLWAWPLSLDGILAPTVRDNPFYATMVRLDPMRPDDLLAGLRALLFDAALRDRCRAAQARYRAEVATLPDGAARLLAHVTT